MAMLDTISHNMANMKTPGFKKGRTVFEAALNEAQSGNGTKGVNFANIREGFTDFSQGVITRTGQSYDLAITGGGFFKVRDDQGNFFYTRQGSFQRDMEGNLVAGGAFKLVDEGGEAIAIEGGEATIGEDGSIQMDSGATKKIPLFNVADDSQLERTGGAFFTLKSGEATLVEKPLMLQGSLEESNVNIMQEMGRMVEAMRVFETTQRALKTYGSLGEKLSEIGTVG
jgi:flagellar basal-body rod protein FlgF/flagellar basal-body rod protein FlgG